MGRPTSQKTRYRLSALLGIAGLAAIGVWAQTIPGRASMEDIVLEARELCGAISKENEREIVTRLRKRISTTANVSLEVIATLKTGEEVDLTTLSDGVSIETISLTIAVGDKEEKIGPCRPHDTNNYFDLFLE